MIKAEKKYGPFLCLLETNDNCSLRCFVISVTFKKHLINYSTSFEEIGRKGLSNNSIFKISLLQLP